MILQNISKAIRGQNYYAVALEFVIVIAGVVIGFQINAWNEVRIDRADERISLEQIYSEITNEMQVESRITEFRGTTLDQLRSASDVIFEVIPDRGLTDTECMALVGSHVLYIGRSTMPTLSCLQSTGRLDIVRDRGLRDALTQLLQSREALESSFAISEYLFDLSDLHPEAFRTTMRTDRPSGGQDDEIVLQAGCDLGKIQENPVLLYRIARNIDGYDAYFKDGLLPWLSQAQRTGAALENYLGYAGTQSEAL